MKFCDFTIEEALGCILAHTIRLSSGSIKKGTVLSLSDIDQLRTAGVNLIMGARLESGDVHEDAAAARIADVVLGKNVRVALPSTGRVNLLASGDGVFQADPNIVVQINRIDEAMTLATLPTNSRVYAGQLVATVKIIPFAVSEDSLFKLETAAGREALKLEVATFRPKRVALILSSLPAVSEKIITKRREAIEKRVSSLSGTLIDIQLCAHSTEETALAINTAYDLGAEIILVFGASAIVDRADIIPMALTSSGGQIVQLGMPVDPGNLLLYGTLKNIPVIGVPSCAASIKENGFDWVLERLFAELTVGRDDIAAMAARGLLTEISSRPMPREYV